MNKKQKQTVRKMEKNYKITSMTMDASGVINIIRLKIEHKLFGGEPMWVKREKITINRNGIIEILSSEKPKY